MPPYRNPLLVALATQPFHILLNLALGSEATGFTQQDGVGITEEQLRATLAQPQAMLVDYVRVYGKLP